MGNITHSDLVEIGYKWLLKNTSCGVAFKELEASTRYGEIPDVIGFGSNGFSILLEAKASRADFLSDKNKPFRKEPEKGMGDQRFYICPAGIIKVEELPENWGLIYVNEERKARCIHRPYKGNIGERKSLFEKDRISEQSYMYSMLRRVEIHGHLDCVYVNPFISQSPTGGGRNE